MKETRRFTSKIVLSATILLCSCFQFLKPVNAATFGDNYTSNDITLTISYADDSFYIINSNTSPVTTSTFNTTDLYFSFDKPCSGVGTIKFSETLSYYEYAYVGCVRTSYSTSSKNITIRWYDTNGFYIRITSLQPSDGTWQTISGFNNYEFTASGSNSTVIPINSYQISAYQVFTKFGLSNNATKPYMLNGTFGTIDSNLVGIAPTQTIYLDFYSNRSIWVDYNSGDTDLTPISTSDSNVTYNIRNIDIVATSDGAFFYHVVFTSSSENILYFYFNIDTYIGADVSIYPVYFGLNSYYPDDLKYMIGDTTEQGVANTWLYMIYTQMVADSEKVDNLNNKVDDLNSNITTINDNLETFNNDFNTAMNNLPLDDISDSLTELSTKTSIFVNFVDTFYDNVDDRIKLIILLPLILGLIALFIGRKKE